VDANRFDEAWADLRRRRKAYGVAWAAFLIALAVNVLWLHGPLAVIAFLPALFLQLWCERFHCPRCSNTFGRRWFFHGTPRRCLHCGTAIGDHP
jgi:Flp pilus assembly protein TadB